MSIEILNYINSRPDPEDVEDLVKSAQTFGSRFKVLLEEDVLRVAAETGFDEDQLEFWQGKILVVAYSITPGESDDGDYVIEAFIEKLASGPLI